MISIGIDLGGTNIKAALVDHKKGFLQTTSIPTHADLGKEHVFDRIALAVKDLVEEHNADPIGVGMGLPGMVSLDRKTVKNPPNLPGWKVENVADEIFKRTGYKCVIENDANLAALGSAHFGKGKAFNSFIMVTLGTGVGGGIIIDKKIYRGTTGMAGELGHVIINYHGPLSNSNTRGGIEAYLGQRFLSRFAADTIRQNPENSLYSKFHKNFDKLEPVDLYHAAEDGNELGIDILRQAGEKLGYAIVNYVHILDIRKIVVSGGVAKAGRWLLQPAEETALKYLMPPFREEFEIIDESLGNDAALLGAASLAFEELR
ncbi:ROK family protein [Rhodohalobacter barkolensis]|uniref:ROK family protein n=1 Tax=Rhodohalobacter barkolensis TaxID=2053187 RepID=A0A2N0VHK3_9BACT|nr:ROK family protein [Rhodohalobacter barkolensis]PKD43673.1 ROK family protein [Rhodohalobacter barkolensis]